MGASYFQFKQFIIHQQHCTMKVTTDSCLFGAWVADRIKEDTSINSILDIGSGTGLLSLILAQKSSAMIDAIELQEKDYLQSVENILASPWKNRIKMTHADAINRQFSKKYDIIVSNPPFYESDLKSESRRKNIAHHGESLTLNTLISIIARQLSPDGKFFLLLPEKRKTELFEIVGNVGLFINQAIYAHQTENHSAFRIMVEGSFANGLLKDKIINIKNGDQYSHEFIYLLKDYYLTL